MLDIKIERTTTPKEKPADETKLGFGHIFTDHMFVMNYDAGQGWHDARIVPYGDLSLSPAAMCLHYGQEIFEGLKAYRTADGSVQLFRPQENFKRMNNSAERMVIPKINEEDMLYALKTLVKMEQDWVPHTEGASLYIRPFIIAVDPYVGVKPADHYLFIIILSPSGAYYSTGLNPVKIYVENKYVRAVRGGTGFAKTAANYAISLAGQEEAHEQDYEQVLWLDGVERKYVEEVGSKSAIEICKKKGYKVSERKISIEEIAEAYDNGKLDEVFGTGTAAVISPVGHLKWGDKVMEINNNKLFDMPAAGGGFRATIFGVVIMIIAGGWYGIRKRKRTI